MFLLWLRQLSWLGYQTPASVPPSTEGRSNPTNPPVFPLSSFVLPSFAWVYIFFSTGQVLLPALSWCSACISVSEGIFLMYLWREIYSMSTYSSAILFSPAVIFFFFSNMVSDSPSRVMKIKTNRWHLIKVKSFHRAKETIKKKTIHRMRGNICK